jgi:anti-anti-sigma factor
MSGEAQVAARRAGRAVVVTLAGEIDRLNAAATRERVEAAVDTDAIGLVADLGAVTYLDSSGVHLLHAIARALGRTGQRLVVVRPRRRTPAAVLALTGIGEIAPLHDDLTAALESLVGA